jgi:predicted ribosome quality control (RQC) complex YloA/Tae2 family protein
MNDRPDIEQLAAAARRKQAREIGKQRRLIANLNRDLEKHGDPQKWKRYGDLLLANASAAVRVDDHIIVTDYFDASTPTIEIEGDANRSVSEIAEEYFRLYSRARNGVKIIEERMAAAENSIVAAQEQLARIEAAVEAGDVEFLERSPLPTSGQPRPKKKKRHEEGFRGARRFISSDGIEIMVGKKAADNDFLTFRIARSLDLWLHAEDYPGSHVVVRLAGRKETPHNTLLEAAQLAAFYSDAREHPKAAVRYTQRKFVNKPRKGPPGLVSLSSFRTILVEPQVPAGVSRAT